MFATKQVVGALTLTATFLAVPLHAQGQSAITGSQLDAAMTSRPVTVSREGVRAFLATDQAVRAAGQLGVSSADLSKRVATLDQATLNRFAQSAGVNDRILAGGRESIVISTTAIIIGLLLIILLAG